MNPYEVLGVSQNADEETVKKAYKELVKKYHPDKYVNNPLADLAAEKMKEINQAYDMIINKKTSTGNSSGYGNTGYGGFGGYQNTHPTFSAVRNLINTGNVFHAQIMLQQLPRTAEWYYLSGLVSIRSGRYTEAIRYMEQAVNMEPNNNEYRDALNNVRNRSTQYNTGGGMYGGGMECCPLPCWCLPCCCDCNPCC